MADILSRPLVIGASGLVGGAVFAALQRYGCDPIGTYSTNPKPGLHQLGLGECTAGFFILHRPSIVFLASALTNVDYCESHEKEAVERNVTMLRDIVDYCGKNTIPLVFFSTDYVFDGREGPYREDAERNAINVYGRTKVAGEDIVATLPSYAIIRITNVFDIGFDEKNFLYRTVGWLRDGRELVLPSDQFATPTYATWLGDQLVTLIAQGKLCGEGGVRVLHMTCDEQLSRIEFAQKVAALLSADASLIIGKPTAELGQAAKRPLRGGLRNDTLKKLLGIHRLSVDEALLDALPRMKALYGL